MHQRNAQQVGKAYPDITGIRVMAMEDVQGKRMNKPVKSIAND
jgi:predicted unusual protein kinase regulating ubiquinone biosynthesis (AarF/ABC1/UbiB family)